MSNGETLAQWWVVLRLTATDNRMTCFVFFFILPVRLANQAQKMVLESSASNALEQRAGLIRSYGNLYAQSRVETLEWLDKLDELRGADELKSKLLFSVIVVGALDSAFRQPIESHVLLVLYTSWRSALFKRRPHR